MGHETDENYAALAISVLRNVPVEAAFRMLDLEHRNGERKNRTWSQKDIDYIEKMREQGIIWRDIALQFNMQKNSLIRIYRYWKKEKKGAKKDGRFKHDNGHGENDTGIRPEDKKL